VSVLDRFRLDGRRALVTGGSRGLGRAMAQGLAEAGADLVLTGRDAASLERAAEEIRALGREVATVQADMGEPAECERACGEALADPRGIDILVNNVGGRRENIPTEAMPLETWRRLLDLNLTSAFLGTKLVGGAMLARGRGGRIINVASINAFVAGRGIAGRHYETAKAAVVQFTRAVAADWAPHGITVNAIAPGFVLSNPTSIAQWESYGEDGQRAVLDRIALRRLGQPEDIAEGVVFLVRADWLTGQVISIDGGSALF
jgi:NAD(P)-dependent dehydrogenase (short-subunit alcohol dehydrogenase family)